MKSWDTALEINLACLFFLKPEASWAKPFLMSLLDLPRNPGWILILRLERVAQKSIP